MHLQDMHLQVMYLQDAAIAGYSFAVDTSFNSMFMRLQVMHLQADAVAGYTFAAYVIYAVANTLLNKKKNIPRKFNSMAKLTGSKHNTYKPRPITKSTS